MMRVSAVGLVICQITVLSQTGKFWTRANRNDEILEESETRYYDHPERNYYNFNDGLTRNEYELPVSFKAPSFKARDYWRTKQEHNNRRTFFEDFHYHRDTTTSFPSFYQFMTSFFGGKDNITPEPPEKFYYNRNQETPPYNFETPPSLRPTEPNYIPPPKPIRASVIKLETITRSPAYPSFEQDTSAKYYPHLETILNHVLIENSKTQNLDLESAVPVVRGKVPSFKPLPVLPKPAYVLPTTLKPTNLRFFNNKTRTYFEPYNETGYKYPESVQDKLPHLNPGGVRIPYVSEKPIPQIFNTLPTETTTYQRPIDNTRHFRPPEDSRATTTNFLELIDIRSLNSKETSGGKRKRPAERIKFDFDATTVRSFPGAIEKIERPTISFTKKISTRPDKTSVERITNLTVQGLSKAEKENANIHKYINHQNVKDLIGYEMSKFQQKQSTTDDTSARLVNPNDELSLDAKILKDTNWDGFAISPTWVTTMATKETTISTTQHIAKLPENRTAFWEIVQEKSTTLPTTLETTSSDRIKPQTTTEFFPWPSTLEVTETNEAPTTTQAPEEITTRKIPEVTKRRTENLPYPVTRVTETYETTPTTERPILRRRYSRRPKTVSFTPYPTPEELQKKLLNRNHFPKRQKPNITLAFGNKNVLKVRQIPGRDEVMKFSDEVIGKKRKFGKRRQVYKRLRVSTTETSRDN